MPSYEFQSDGSVVVSFSENGTSVTIPNSPLFQMDDRHDDWHEYTVTGTAVPYNGFTLEDIQLALLQQSAPEWRDLRIQDLSGDTPPATTGSFTDTFGPGQVSHIVSDDGLVVVNQTHEGHPFHPGVVVRTVVENPDGTFEVISYGIGNTAFDGGITETVLGTPTALINQGFGMVLFSDMTTIRMQATVNKHFREGTECFGPDVPIDMWPLDPKLKPGPDGIYDQDEVRAKVWKKPIELIAVGDIVVSFDDNDNLVPGPVTRTFQNNAKILLDFHGTRVTPGHVYYRPDSKKSYKYETLIDVLRDDGVIKHQDGTLIRAATNVPVDSPRDGFVRAVAGKRKADGSFEQTDEGRIRLGTRFLVGTDKERKSWAVADLIAHNGGVVGEDELIHVGDNPGVPFTWDFADTLPKPEDFVLACSGTTLEDIYKAAEWESQGPRLPAPMVLDRGPVQPLKGAALSAMPRNEPLSVSHAPVAAARPQRTLNRKQRKAMEAKQRKAAKARKSMVG